MRRTWERIEAWLEKNAAEVRKTLQRGATEQELKAVEQALRVVLPESVKDFYRIHNGQATDEYGFTGAHFLFGWEWPHLKRAVQQWTILTEVLDNGDFDGIHSEPDEGIRNDWWNRGWIPITQNATGDHICLDLAPATDGQRGQIVTWWHDAPERNLEAQSFEEWINQFADGLETGLYVFSKGYGGIIDAKEAKYYDE
jgi:cell wall assembly regulator SMI1